MSTTYDFEARNPDGQVINGSLVADNESRAEKILWQNHLSVISLKPKKEIFKFFETIFGRISERDKFIFCKQIATMLEAGFPILQALSVIILQTQNNHFKEIISIIIADLEQGHSFSTAISKYPEVFNNVFASAVKAGEASGKLPQVLRQISDTTDRDYQFSSKIKGAIAYPIFIIIAMIVIGAIMLIKVIPQLESLFREAGTNLPWSTRAVIWTSHFLQKFWWAIILVIIGIWLAFKAWGKTPLGRYQIDMAKIKAPIISQVVTLVYMSRFCRTLSLLLNTGIPILQSIKIVSEIMTNVVYQEGLDEVYQQVEKGTPMNVPLSKNKYFPPMISQMVGVGEKTGKLDEILESLANFYEAETDNQMKKLSSLLEPVLIVIIGIGVAIMVFSIITPIYNLAQFM